MKKIFAMLSLFAACSACAAFAACTGDDGVSITYNTCGGTAIDSATYDVDESFTLPTDVTYEGYEFEGWYTNADYTGSAVTTATATVDVTYYAKWAKLYTVTLDVNGGQLSTTSVQLKEGGNVYDAVADYSPTKTDHQFAGWLYSGAVLAKNTEMPASNITLTADYNVKYTVELYVKAIDGDDYVKSENSVMGYAKAGVKYTPELSADVTTGLVQASNDGEVTELTISATPSENVYKYYFDRKTFVVTFRENFPDGSGSVYKSVDVVYGSELTLPADLQFEGYCLEGWSETQSGEVAYAVDAISVSLYPQSETALKAATIPAGGITSDTNLYAVWMKGYTDMFGSEDSIYLFDGEEEGKKEIYLNRAGVYFKGTYKYDETTGVKKFTFGDTETESDTGEYVYIEGRLFEDGTFAYRNDTLSTKTYSLSYYSVNSNSKMQKVTDESTEISFDGYNGITYTKNGDESKGTFTIASSGEYIATFTDGALQGQTLCLQLSEVTDTSGDATYLFMVRDDEEYGKVYYRSAVYNSSDSDSKVYSLGYYSSPYYTITLDGYGTATYSVSSSSSYSYAYVLDEETLKIASVSSSSSSVAAQKLILSEVNGTSCYIPYSSTYDFSATVGDNGDKLVLDGAMNAVYTVDGVATSGYYSVSSTALDSYLVLFIAKNESSSGGTATKKFLVTKTDTKTENEDGTTTTVTTYSARVKPLEYMEYYYANENGAYKLILVLNDDEDGTDALYAYDLTDGNGYDKISTGIVAETELSGIYIYTQSTLSVPEGWADYVPSSSFASFVFTVSSKTSSSSTYYVHYWLAYKGADDENYTGVESTRYSSADTEGETMSLLYDTIAIIKDADGEYSFYSYAISDTLLAISQNGSYVYYRLDETANTYTKLAIAPRTLYLRDSDGSADTTCYIYFDGTQDASGAYGATYTYVEDETSVTVNGTVTEDSGVYTLTLEGGDVIKYKVVYSSSSSSVTYYFCKYIEAADKKFVSETATLTLDGYGVSAVYTSGNVTYSGLYAFTNENKTVIIVYNSSYLYIDSDTAFTEAADAYDMSFSLRGSEAGTYVMYNNYIKENLYFTFDGHGNLTVYTVSEDDDETQTVIDEEATYTVSDGYVTVTYTQNAQTVTCTGMLGTLTSSGTGVFIKYYQSVSYTFVNENDWSVFVLDGIGGATRYIGSSGESESGSYVIVTDDLFYYVNSDSTYASLFRYSVQDGTATKINQKARGYYTEDMESLLFTTYGVAVFNGDYDNLYYYEVITVNSEKILRIYSKGGTAANDFGYSYEDIAYSTEQIIYNSNTYMGNSGYSIEFKRSSDDVDKYPILSGTSTLKLQSVVFTPSGDITSSSSVSGTAYLNDKAYDCTVRCIVGIEKTAYYVYVTVSDKSYIYYIGNMKYVGTTGEDEQATGSFTVTALNQSTSYYSDSYLTMSYIYYKWFSTYISNTYGVIAEVTEYAEDGTVSSQYLMASFGSSSGAYDVNSELMYFDEDIKLTYTTAENDDGETVLTAKGTYSDGYTYTLSITLTTNSIYKTQSYVLNYILREETFTTADGNYTVTVQKLIAGEDISSLDYVISKKTIDDSTTLSMYTASVVIKEKSSGTEITYDEKLGYSDGVYCIKRTVENEKITSSTYYKVAFEYTYDEDGRTYPVYTSAAVTVISGVKTYYDAAGTSYIDVDADNNVLCVNLEGVSACPTSSSYDSTTATYTVKISSSAAYSVKVSENTITITEVGVSDSEDGDSTDDTGDGTITDGTTSDGDDSSEEE